MGKLAISEMVLFDEPSNKQRATGGVANVFRLLWDTWDMNNFYFLFLLFSDFIGILFSFCFLFFWTMKRHVTSQSHDVSHDVTS